jgi:hypothetical protein
MEKFWNIFWKVFGAAIILALLIGIVIGFVFRSPGIAFEVVQKSLVAGMGVAGIIGFVVVPVMMYFEDRRKGEEENDAAY